MGGWARVYRKDRSRPFFEEVSLREYDKKQSKWKDSPCTMIRKVALVHALREAFPATFGGLYAPEEVGVDVEGAFREAPDDALTPEKLEESAQRRRARLAVGAAPAPAPAPNAPAEGDDPFAAAPGGDAE